MNSGVADLLGDSVQVEGLVVAGRGVDVTRVVDRVLVRNQHRLRHFEARAASSRSRPRASSIDWNVNGLLSR